jgi:hypothetical protein
VTTSQNSETLSLTPAGLPFAPPDPSVGLHAPANSAPSASGSRQRYVVGVFILRSDASRAVAELARVPCEVLVVSAAPVEPSVWTARQGVTFRQVDQATALSDFTAILSASPCFSVLGPSGESDPVTAGRTVGVARHFDSLVRHLASDATVILVQAGGQDAYLRASRILLDGKCVMLVTHDVRQTEHPADRAHVDTDACCQNCTSRTCGKLPLPLE